MADSTTWLETIAAAQSQKEVTANALFDAQSPASSFGRHAEACSGLTWGYYGGRIWDGTNALSKANGTVLLTGSSTNYVEADTGSPFGQVTANTSGWTAGSIRMAKVVTSASAVTSYEDHRTFTFPGSAAAGFVTSVALSLPVEFTVSGSPVTGSGTLTGTKATQSANRVWAGPTSGSAAQPAFRALVGADLPTFIGDDGGSPDSSVKGAVPVANQGDAAASKYLKADGTWGVPAGTGGAGSVTSVAASVPSDLLSVSGSPVTTSGTLAFSKVSVDGNMVYAGPTAGSPTTGVPTFRALVQADLPAQPYDVGGAVSGVPSASAVLIRYPFPRAVVFPSSLTLSRGVAATAATAQTDFDILKNGVSFGTMRFAAAGTTASFISASGSTFAAGDILTVVAPGSPDATLASVGFSLAGTR